MRIVIVCTMFLILSANSFCQEIQSSKTMTNGDYFLTKSKTQKLFGFILLGSGAATLIVISKGNTDLKTVGPLAVVGTLSTLGSIPLFIASRRNKRKSSAVSTSLMIEKTQVIQQAAISFHSLPAISIKIKLG